MNLETYKKKTENIFNKYQSELELLDLEFIKNSEFQVGDFVKVWWESRDYGKESAFAFISFVGIRHHSSKKEFMYYFRKVNKNGKQSKHALVLPKYTKILKIQKQ
jgi:hypothetical protein